MNDIRHLAVLAEDFFGNLIPDRVLLEYNGPYLFTFISQDKKQLLAYLCDEENGTLRYIVVPSSDAKVERMISGVLSISEMLDQAWGWIVDVNGDQVQRVYQVELDEIPSEYKPESKAYLPGTKTSELTIRLQGENLNHKSAPLSVMKYAAEHLMAAVRGLVDYASNRIGVAFSDAQSREISDLSIRGMALGSLEISVQLSPSDEERNGSKANELRVKDEVMGLFDKALEWAADPKLMETFVETVDGEECVALLSTIERLTPSGRGNVQAIELSGNMVGRKGKPTIKLMPDFRPKVRRLLNRSYSRLSTPLTRSIRWPQYVEADGVVKHIDDVDNTLILGEVQVITVFDDDAGGEWPLSEFILFSYDPNIWRDQIIQALKAKSRIAILGALVARPIQSENRIIHYSARTYRIMEIRVIEIIEEHLQEFTKPE